jgi:hypothetical protein
MSITSIQDLFEKQITQLQSAAMAEQSFAEPSLQDQTDKLLKKSYSLYSRFRE